MSMYMRSMHMQFAWLVDTLLNNVVCSTVYTVKSILCAYSCV